MRAAVALLAVLAVLGPAWALAPEADPLPLLRGLVDRWDLAPLTHRAVVDAFVINAYWKDLQPDPFGTLNRSTIEAGLEKARAAAPLQVAVKLRVFAGVHAPGWAKVLDGSPVHLLEPQGGGQGDVGRFWTDNFRDAYDDLQTKLGQAYDAEPLLVEVTVSRCMTFYAEPFQRQTAEPANHAAYLDPETGVPYSLEADHRCHEEQLATHARAWPTTRSSLALSPHQVVNSEGRRLLDLPFTIAMLERCRLDLDQRCVLENNSIRCPAVAGPYATMYGAMRDAGPPITLQTATPKDVGDLNRTLLWAWQLGANAVELPNGYEDIAPLWAAADPLLEANPAEPGILPPRLPLSVC